MKLTITIISLAIITLVSSCSKNNGCKDGNCEKTVLVNNQMYNSTSTNNYMINEAIINGDCLEIKFGSSGCDSKSWIVELVDAAQVTEPPTPQRSLKLALTNNELCAAAFSKTVSFDLTPLRIKGSSKVNLLLAGYNQPLIYSY